MSTKFLVIYDQPSDPTLNAERDRLRPEHIAFRKGLGAALALAGPLLDDENGPVGSVIIVAGESRAAVAALATEDPFVKAGVLTIKSITPMRIAMIAPDAAG